VCPFVDRPDPRCAAHLSLENISSAFAYCADRYTECPIYRQLLSEGRARESSDTPVRVAAGG
jgi:hypothetical protein